MSVGEPLSIQGAQLLSGYAHLAVLAALALLSPRSAPGDEPDAESIEDRIALMRQMLEASVGAAGTPLPAIVASVDVEDEADATPAAGRAGSEASNPVVAHPAGTPGLLRRAPAPSSVAGASRDATLREASGFGMVGALGNLGSAGAGTPRWSASNAEGMLGAGDLGDSGGLGLSGIGEGGSDGWGNGGILLGRIGTLGHDTGSAEGFGATGGWGRLAGHHAVGPVICGCDGTQVNGRLPPEAIQRVVRQNMGRFRYCYERALDRDPGLQGRVVTRFLIARDGSVGFSADVPEESDFPEPGVVSCIVRAFGALSFPVPEGGTVSVVYPLSLSPSG